MNDYQRDILEDESEKLTGLQEKIKSAMGDILIIQPLVDMSDVNDSLSDALWTVSDMIQQRDTAVNTYNDTLGGTCSYDEFMAMRVDR